MIRSLSRPSRVSSGIQRSEQELVRENKNLREQIMDLKALNSEYAALLGKSLEVQFSETAALTARETRLAHVNNYQREFIAKLKEEIQVYRSKEEEVERVNALLKNKPFRSIEDFFGAYEALTGEVGRKKQFIESLEETISKQKRELQDEG